MHMGIHACTLADRVVFLSLDDSMDPAAAGHLKCEREWTDHVEQRGSMRQIPENNKNSMAASYRPSPIENRKDGEEGQTFSCCMNTHIRGRPCAMMTAFAP
jgi:hypothetical protein